MQVLERDARNSEKSFCRDIGVSVLLLTSPMLNPTAVDASWRRFFRISLHDICHRQLAPEAPDLRLRGAVRCHRMSRAL
jgi:hypothetical protein